jgi:cytochrome c oxidase subunit 2
MLAGAVLILAGVMGTALFALVRRSTAVNERAFLAAGGLAFPAVTLTALMVFALMQGDRLFAAPARDDVRVQVTARQWHWEFRYPDAPGGPRGSRDRLLVPAGRWIEVEVRGGDVIHSFWVPRLGGKIDAIPGHVNRIRLRAARPGVYTGQCSEFCGTGHAAMIFLVEAVAPEAYDDLVAALPPATVRAPAPASDGMP